MDSKRSDIQESVPSSHQSLSVQGIIDSNCSNSFQRICKYDVFISFRGPDTRYNFTDHLYNQLIARGISTFIDDHELEKGQPISSQLLQAIKDSHVSIIVFSEDYATSTWCLEEMATIFDCHKDFKQIVFPIFYDMDPSDVRHQSGVYEEAFASHTEKFEEDLGKVHRWKRAMENLANFVGWDVRDRSEFDEIGKIVHTVIKALGHKFSGFVDDLVGIQSRVDELENHLKLSSRYDGFRVLGVWGMGGIGKTTLVTTLYDKISYQFDACSFIEDTSQIYKDGGVSAIHKQILRQALHEQNLDTHSPHEISGILRNMLLSRKVLVILDNVDGLGQLEKLAIGPRFPCAGSRIIITTRDEHILKVYGADAIYKVPLLNKKDAYLLFRRKAFKGEYPKNEFLELIPEVLKYTKGLPLAIRVMGSFLCTRNAIQWGNALDRLRSNPNNEIIDVLRISFDGLDPEEKETFLHIACFFKGEREDYVKRILDGCGLHPYIGIPIIIEKSLIFIVNNEIHMHEMLQKLGIKIVREESPECPGSWSRLWLYHDFRNVLKSKLGTNNTKAIVLNQEMDGDWLEAEELSKMKSLKLLILCQRNFSGSLHFLSNELHWLSWQGYPFHSLPPKFESHKLVELNISNSNIRQLWEGIKYFCSLKRMDLSNSKYLESTPNFEGTPNLERLDLTGCTTLSLVHPSIGFLTKLVYLSFRNCTSLNTLYLGSLSSLRVLYLSGCTSLDDTPDFKESPNLEYLDLEQCTSLSHIHQSIWALNKLKYLSLRHCHMLVLGPVMSSYMPSLVTLDLCNCRSMPPAQIFPLQYDMLFYSLKSLIFLDLGFCNLNQVSDGIGYLRSLERLNLQGNNLDSLPATISWLSSLAYLNLSHCHQLLYLPRLLLLSRNDSSVGRYFETVSGSRNSRSGLYFYDCPNLVESQLEEALAWLRRLIEEPRHFRCGFDIIIGTHKSVIPKWFNHQFPGNHSIKTIMSSDVDDNWIGFSFCVAFEVHQQYYDLFSSRQTEFSCLSSPPPQPHPLYLSFENEHTEERFNMPLSFKQENNVGSRYLWIIYISRPHCHFAKSGAHISFKAHPGLEVMNWGLRVLLNEDIVTTRRKSWDELVMQVIGAGKQVHNFTFDYAQETEKWRSCSDKIQLPYNWLVTEEEEMENMAAKRKENDLSIIGLSQPPLEDIPSSSRQITS